MKTFKLWFYLIVDLTMTGLSLYMMYYLRDSEQTNTLWYYKILAVVWLLLTLNSVSRLVNDEVFPQGELK